MRIRRSLACLLVLGAFGCAGKSAPAPSEKAGEAGRTINELSAITVEDRNGTKAVLISGTQPMSPQGNCWYMVDAAK